MDYGMKGNVALVTGAGSGIGYEAAKIFAAEGAKVVLSGRNEAKLQAVQETIKNAGGEASYFVCDITVEEDCKALVDYTVATYGRLDYAFNNAGVSISAGGPLHTVDKKKFEDCMAANFWGVLYCMQYELAVMDKQGKGAIVNTCSINSIQVTKFGTPYSVSKYAVYGLTRAAALDYADRGIRINAIGPGPTDTPMIALAKERVPDKIQALADRTPDKKLGKPENQANMAVFLCSDLADHINAELVIIDGGLNAQQ